MKLFERLLAAGPNLLDYIAGREHTPSEQLQPQRNGFRLLLQPLSGSLTHQSARGVEPWKLLGMRYFLFDGFFSTASDSFYLTFVPLFALAYNASGGAIGLMTAAANLVGTIALFPGAKIADVIKRRRPLIVASGGGVGRLVLIVLVFLPFLAISPAAAVVVIIAVNAVRAFTGNLGSPAWTAFTADLVPPVMRARYFGNRNTMMGVAALFFAPIAGWLISAGNRAHSMPRLGYQVVFFLALVLGMASTYCFNHIPEPERAPAPKQRRRHRSLRSLRLSMRANRSFMGFVASAFVWNLALQVAGPFFNVYLVTGLGGNDAQVGIATGVSNLTNLIGLWVFAYLAERRGNYWVQKITGFLIPLMPLAWVFAAHPWHIYLINTMSGFLWAGYNLSNFNLLLEYTPESERARAVALFQSVVFGSAVVGPIVGGYLADVASYRLVFLLSAIGRWLAAFLFVWLVHEVRRGRGAPKHTRGGDAATEAESA